MLFLIIKQSIFRKACFVIVYKLCTRHKQIEKGGEPETVRNRTESTRK